MDADPWMVTHWLAHNGTDAMLAGLVTRGYRVQIILSRGHDDPKTFSTR